MMIGAICVLHCTRFQLIMLILTMLFNYCLILVSVDSVPKGVKVPMFFMTFQS